MRIFQPDTYVTVDYAAKRVARYHRLPGQSGQRPQIAQETIPVEPGDALQMELCSFIQACAKRSRPAVTGEDGKKALALAVAISGQIQMNQAKIPSIVSFYKRKGNVPDRHGRRTPR